MTNVPSGIHLSGTIKTKTARRSEITIRGVTSNGIMMEILGIGTMKITRRSLNAAGEKGAGYASIDSGSFGVTKMYI